VITRSVRPMLAIAAALGVVLGASACTAEHGSGGDASTASVAASSQPQVGGIGAAATPGVAPGGSASGVPTPLGDATQDWPAVDLGQRLGAAGEATEVQPGVYRYVVAPDDTTSGLLTRFDLCAIDIETAYEAAGGHLAADEAVTVQRSMRDSSGNDTTAFHRGWKCTYPEQPRTSRAG